MQHRKLHLDLELRHVDPARGRARRYHVSECRSLFGEFGLLVTWGRIGKPTRVRLETFASAAELGERRTELLARRFAHGYAIHEIGRASVQEGRDDFAALPGPCGR